MSPVRGLRGGGWFGSAVPLRRFNRLPRDQAAELLQTCLPVERWVRTIIDARSFRTLDDLLEVAREAAFPFTPAELEAALAHGDVPVVVPPARRSDSLPRRESASSSRPASRPISGGSPGPS